MDPLPTGHRLQPVLDELVRCGRLYCGKTTCKTGRVQDMKLSSRVVMILSIGLGRTHNT